MRDDQEKEEAEIQINDLEHSDQDKGNETNINS